MACCGAKITDEVFMRMKRYFSFDATDCYLITETYQM